MDDNIEIVIKISEKEYNEIKENKYGVFGGHIFETIRNGRPLSDYPPNYQRMAIGLHPIIHHGTPIAKEDIDNFEPKWIPIKDMIPGPCRNILVCDSDGDIYVSYMRTDYTFGFDEFGNKIKNVIAWMYAPEPYKESEVEK